MPISGMREQLVLAKQNNRAIGAFNVGNMEQIIGTIKAAEDMNTPIIIQVAEGRMKYFPLHLIGPMMVSAAKKSSVDVCVHLDHGQNPDIIKACIDLGFTSVMFDGSHLSLEENIRRTQEVCHLAKKAGVAVEGELGLIGGSEGGKFIKDINCTDPEEAMKFIRETNVDALAIAIGNVHGKYYMEPKLNFEVLDTINKSIDIPLVLHGGSGISDYDFKKTINHGIRKINIATAVLNSLMAQVVEYSRQTTEPKYFELNERMIAGAYECVRHHIKVFNNEGM